MEVALSVPPKTPPLPPDRLTHKDPSKRQRPPILLKKRIEFLEELTQQPHYLRPSSVQYTFNELPTEYPPRKIHQPAKFVCWKYIGETDGVLGCLTGRLNARDPPEKISRELAAIPFEIDLYKVPQPSKMKEKRPKIHPRDLFAMSIQNATREAARQRQISKLRDEKAENPPKQSDVLIFMETDVKRVPLVASRLKGR
jgi:hypothetical protein